MVIVAGANWVVPRSIAEHTQSASELLGIGVILHLPVVAQNAQSAAIEAREEIVRSWIVTHFPVSVYVWGNWEWLIQIQSRY